MNKSLLALAAMAVAFSAHAQDVKVAQNTNAPGASSEPVPKTDTGWKMPAFKGPLGYPGNTWGTLVYGVKRPSGDTGPSYRIEGIVEQGIDWFRFGDGTWKYNTYVAGEYVINSLDSDATPVIGMKVNKRFTDGSLDLGLRYKYGNTYISPNGSFAGGQERKGRIEVHATYWFDWNLKKD